MKKKNAIFLSDTRDFLVGQMLVQINNTNPGLFDEALIYYDKEIDKKDKKIMESIMPCRFIKYNSKIDENFYKKDRFKRFTKLAFARYEMFNHLSEYENILWIDTDVVIQGSLKPLLDKASTTGMAMLCEDEVNKSAINTDVVRTNFTISIPSYDMNLPLYCSGLIVVNEKLKDYDLLTSWCYEKTDELADYLNLPDQGVLNLMIQEFELDVVPIGDNGKYGAMPYYGRDCSKSVVVHSWGRNKFWNSWYLLKKYPKWYEAYLKWIELGGSAYDKEFLPDVSVVIPVYKPNLEYFKILLDSLVNQKCTSWEEYQNFEIIIVAEPQENNNLKKFIKSYNDPRINLIINETRLGIAASINIGMRQSLGRYIARVDDDDICNEYRLYKQVQFLDNHQKINLCTSDYSYFGDMNEYRISFEGDMSYAWGLFTCPFDHPTIMFRKDFFVDNNLFYDENRRFVEDWELWIRAFEKGMVVGCIHEELYKHRWYNGQAGQSNKTVEMMRELVGKNFKKLGVDLSEDDLLIVAPWQGKISEDKLIRLEEIYAEALQKNQEKKLYNQRCLAKVFDLRMFEAKNGYMKDIVIKNSSPVSSIPQNIPYKKTLKQKLLGPAYRPFKRVFYNIMTEAVNNNINSINENTNNNMHLLVNQLSNNIEVLDNKISSNLDTIEKGINNKKRYIQTNSKIVSESKQEFEKRFESIEKRFEEIEKNFDSTENSIKKELSYIHNQIYDLEKKYDFLRETEISNLYFEKKIILIGTSEHHNIGDAAITMGVYEFFRKHFNGYKIIEISTYQFNDNLSYLENIINPEDLIFLQGGGNLGNKYLSEEEVRRTVIGTFLNNKIVILPQTIYFDETIGGKKELEVSKDIYNKHPNLLIFTRGEESLKKAQEYFPNAKSYLSLDSALNLHYVSYVEREGIICCVRDLDDESGLNKEQYNKIINTVKNYDSNYRFTTNVYEKDIKKDNRNSVVYSQLKEFSSSKVVVTDRLHGLIFALITNTPCIVISSYNYKLNEYVDILKDNKSIKFIDKNIDSLDEEIKMMINKPIIVENDFSDNFDTISEIINKN